mgnify:CR=1 FL=1
MSQLNQQITHAQKELSTNLTPQQQQQQKQQAMAVGSHFTQAIASSKTTQYVLYAILVLLVIVIMMLIQRRGGYKLQTVTEAAGGTGAANQSNDSDTKDEYDFMNSDEAIPAKLDLARAYMAMEDYKSARKVLEQVGKNGNAEQQAEAKVMLDKIPNK